MKKLSNIIFASLVILLLSSANMFAQYVNIPDANFKAYLVGNGLINTSGDAEIDSIEAGSFTGGIYADSLGIADLTGIETFTSLTILDVRSNSLTSIDLSYNLELTSVNCSYNALTCLDLSTNSYLTFVDCSYNGVVFTGLNLRNGNNTSITSCVTWGNGMLYCIQVDDLVYANANWPHDTWSVYNLVCGTWTTSNFTHNGPVCMGSPITFTNLSTFATSYHWNFGDFNTSTVTSPTHIYGAPGGYTAKLIAQNCNSKDTSYVYIPQGMDISGHVTYSGGDVTNGVAIIYPSLPFYTSFDTAQIRNLDSFGYYYFNTIPNGPYLIQIFPDTAAYPTLIPTYYTSEWAWDSAATFNHLCTFDGTADISMVELTPTTPNIGYLEGYVIEGPGFGRAEGEPVHGVVVKLGVTASTSIIASTTTDTITGQYSFGNVPFGNYTIYVDIPGLERDSTYDLTIDAANYQFLNLYYVVDSVRIYIVPGIGIEDLNSTDPNTIRVFPNPGRENVNIEYTIFSDAKVQLDIYNMYGIKVQSLVNTQLVDGTYNAQFNPKQQGLKPGVYFISLSADGRRKTQRIVIME